MSGNSSNRWRVARLAAVGFLALVACDGSATADRAAVGEVERTVADAARPAAADDVAAETPAAATAPREIYYDLTIFDWYRRGEPLRGEARGYLPEGKPRALAPDSLRRAGRYGGVDYYVQPGRKAPYDSVFVPVFEGYWQPFVATEAGPKLADG